MKTWPISIPSHLFVLCCCSSLRYPFHVRLTAITKFWAGPARKLDSTWKHSTMLEPPAFLNCYRGSWHSFGLCQPTLCQRVPCYIYGLGLPTDPFPTGKSDTVNLLGKVRDFNRLSVGYSTIVGLSARAQARAHLVVIIHVGTKLLAFVLSRVHNSSWGWLPSLETRCFIKQRFPWKCVWYLRVLLQWHRYSW